MTTSSPLPAPSRISPTQLTLLIVCVVSIYFVISFYAKTVETYRIGERATQIQREIGRLEAANKTLHERVGYLATDAYLETTARDKLNLVRPGDRSLIAVPAQEGVPRVDSPPALAEPARLASELGYLAEWLALFFGPR